MFCSNCGKEIIEGDAFCSYCGCPCEKGDIKAPSLQQIENGCENSWEKASVRPTEAMLEDRPVMTEAGMVKPKKKKKKIIIIAIMLLAIICLAGFLTYMFCFTNMLKNDEALIENRLNSFITNLNSGNYDAVAECMDKETRESWESEDDAVNEMMKDIIGLEIGYSDILKFGMGIADDELFKLKGIQNIKVDKDNATADVLIKFDIPILSKMKATTFTVKLVKENKGFLNYDWYIFEISLKDSGKDKKSTTV